MVPPEKLTPKMLAALGLLGTTQACTCLSVQACLDYPAPVDTGDTGDTGDPEDTGDSGLGPCLDVAFHDEEPSEAADGLQGPELRSKDPVSEVVEAVVQRTDLPDDIASRIFKG